MRIWELVWSLSCLDPDSQAQGILVGIYWAVPPQACPLLKGIFISVASDATFSYPSQHSLL